MVMAMLLVAASPLGEGLSHAEAYARQGMFERLSFWMIDWNSRAIRSAPPPWPAMMTISTGFCGFQPSAEAETAPPSNAIDAAAAMRARRVTLYVM